MYIHSLLSDYFPYCTHQGADCSMVNAALIRQLTLKKRPLSIPTITSIIKEHLVFLQHGGAGGKWKTIHLKGIVVALYFGNEVTKGAQASFELQQLPTGVHLKEIVLPFANFCSSRIEQANFQAADLSYSIFTDAAAEGTNFSEANLAYVDFTRANLENADFREAHLVGADFENCNLQGADFRGAKLSGARFPGAKLANVLI